MSRFRTVIRRGLWGLLALLIIGLLLPEGRHIPVQGADSHDWHPQTFWYHPWGKSGVHKGVDIFAPAGTPVVASSGGLVLYRGDVSRGGKVVLITDAAGLNRCGDQAWRTIELPDCHPFVAPILYTIPVQLLAYHIAILKGTDVDQPRNLAKSVTVE